MIKTELKNKIVCDFPGCNEIAFYGLKEETATNFNEFHLCKKCAKNLSLLFHNKKEKINAENN